MFAHATPVVRTGAGRANIARFVPDPHGIAVRAVYMSAVGLAFDNQVAHRPVVGVLFPSLVRRLRREVSDDLLIKLRESHRISSSHHLEPAPDPVCQPRWPFHPLYIPCLCVIMAKDGEVALTFQPL